ncbi:hypothetical protein RJT34_01277 [Clitoria ternatea]|uniref:Uncharacterized protein n=1 Tax=Clitoria ternatea TaxID=43366 RepID=A0AAN9KJ63_CLITE
MPKKTEQTSSSLCPSFLHLDSEGSTLCEGRDSLHLIFTSTKQEEKRVKKSGLTSQNSFSPKLLGKVSHLDATHIAHNT